MVVPVAGTLREAICNAAKANASGTCKQEYLDQTHNGDLTVPVSVHWCGIFAAWVWRQASALVYFKRGDKTKKGEFGGIWRESPDQFLGASGRLNFLWPGDIIVFSPVSHGRNHHAIVAAVSLPATKFNSQGDSWNGACSQRRAEAVLLSGHVPEPENQALTKAFSAPGRRA